MKLIHWQENISRVKETPLGAEKDKSKSLRTRSKREMPAFPDEKMILEVVKRHPEGIKLVDIGNELGVNWRTLVEIIKHLVDEGKVEKVGNMYYPIKENERNIKSTQN